MFVKGPDDISVAAAPIPRSSGSAGQPPAGMGRTQDHAGRPHRFTAFPGGGTGGCARRGQVKASAVIQAEPSE